ncbi:MAG: peptide-methionine (R)-S-oxide reductase MsrB [Hyphomonadaceae bacterium]|nr:peptide-methionine (R)-S-oxide reductase MsrB [Clostridia bacterium]
MNNQQKMQEITLAGGCFWGVEAFFRRIAGVIEVTVGYANGKTQNPKYRDIAKTGHVEAVHIKYDSNVVTLQTLLAYLFKIIDPVSVNKQGNDVGTQYRTGIYYADVGQLVDIKQVVEKEQLSYKKQLAIEVLPLENYYLAEQYHQDYLGKNPNGYCHIDFSKLKDVIHEKSWDKPTQAEIKKKLTALQYKVTQQNATEPPFDNAYWDNHQKGIYVDIITGEPLFISSDKFESGCGWPSFTRPIVPDILQEKVDNTHGMMRTEVRSRIGDSHLGHIFQDAPIEKGGVRYCINSAALRFIPFEEMIAQGYGKYLSLCDRDK